MLQVAPHSRILAAVTPIDFRKGIDGASGSLFESTFSRPSFRNDFSFSQSREDSDKNPMLRWTRVLALAPKGFLKENSVGGQQVRGLQSRLIAVNC